MLSLLFALAPGVGQAEAAPSDVAPGYANGHLTATWTLPGGSNAFVVEAAVSPDTNPEAGAAKGYFLDQNRVAIGYLSNPSALNWVSPGPVGPGTYYLHVGSYDPATCPMPLLGCELDFSEIVSVEAVGDPPPPPPPPPGAELLRIKTASVINRVVSVTWSKPSGMVIDSIDVASSPDVIADGSDLDGLFLEQNVVSTQPLGGANVTGAVTRKLNGGTYWVQVVGQDPEACANPATPECYTGSPPVRVDIAFNTPVMRSAGFDSEGKLGASWYLPSDLHNDLLEVATSPAVYPTGERQGLFLAENVIHKRAYQGGGGGAVSSYTSSVPIGVKPGFYYVHVRAKSCEFLPCNIYPVSDTSRIWVPGPPVPVADKAARISSITIRSTQSVRALYVSATMGEPGTLIARGTIDVPGAARVLRLKGTAATAKPGVSVRLRLKASTKVQQAVRKALRRKRRVRAKIQVIAQDRAGNTKARNRTIKLKR